MTKNETTVTKVRFPEYRRELLSMLEQDQRELRSLQANLQKLPSKKSKKAKEYETFRECHIRAHRMLDILNEIKEPTAENIGIDGSRAISVIALHSYLSVMKKVLVLFEKHFKTGKGVIDPESIVSLTDRIMIIEHKYQRFGSNWMIDSLGKPFLITVEDFKKMNQRRAKYGLKPRQRPIDLSYDSKNKYPLGKGLAKELDQRTLSESEYRQFTKYKLRPLLSRAESRIIWQNQY